jgi:hypothetical protein
MLASAPSAQMLANAVPKRQNEKPAIPAGWRKDPAAYFTAATLALRRDLYRAPVFL